MTIKENKKGIIYIIISSIGLLYGIASLAITKNMTLPIIFCIFNCTICLVAWLLVLIKNIKDKKGGKYASNEN